MGIRIGEAIRVPIDIIQRNPGILVPALLPAIVSLIFAVVLGGMLGMAWMMNPAMMAGLLGLVGLYVISMVILGVIAGGAIVSIAYSELMGKTEDYMTGIRNAVDKLGPLLLAALIIAVGIFIGSLLLVIPGLIFALLVIFTIQEIMIENKSAIEAISASIDMVKKNFIDVLIFAIVIGVIVLIISFVLNLIPYIGGFLAALIITPYVSTSTTVAYLQLKGVSV
jgi:uncharacterized membrane protein